MKEINFYNFNIEQGYFSCTYQDHINQSILEFKLSHKIKLNNNLIALALSTLCARGNYEKIYFDLPISIETLKDIKEFCYADVNSTSVNYPKLEKHHGYEIGLNFSGGFDSLAAKALMPIGTKLISMDFGGRFSREGVFFKKFNPYILETNILDTHLIKNSWSFMGIASILYSEYLGLKYLTFGGILEAGSSNMIANPPAAKMKTFNPFEDSGMTNAPYVLGITEIGTALIVAQTSPEHIIESLNSLANDGEPKKFRKQLIVDTVFNKFNIGCKVDHLDTPNNKWNFGESFASDFLSFYFIKHTNRELIERMYKSIPDEIIDISKKLSLNFYERINTNFLEKFPSELLPEISNKLYQLGIIPYTEQDWAEFRAVVGVLQKYYKF